MKKIIWQLLRKTRSEFIFLKLASLHSFFRRFIPRHYYYTAQKKIITRNGIKYQLDLSDYTQWKIYSYNNNTAIDLAYHSLKQHSSVVLDIGSNVGEFTFKLISQFLKQSDGDLTIYAFEPNPTAYKNFVTNASLNEFPEKIKILPFNIGLGNKRETKKINISQDHSGASSLLNSTESDTIVDIWSLDEFMTVHATDRIDFIKIDVECFEPFVMQGATEVIKRFRPSIYIEHNVKCTSKHKMGEDFIYNFLISHGYRIEAEAQGTLIAINDFESLKKMGKTDILAIPN